MTMRAIARTRPDLALERTLAAELGYRTIAGLDEAGRGALAGSVFAAAVILSLDDDDTVSSLHEVDDSKRLSPATRDRLYERICQTALAYGIGSASPAYIDRNGIISATRRAMADALNQLTQRPDYLLIDGPLKLTRSTFPQRPVVRGDQLSRSIAAASILAKVSRDRAMIALSERYPLYGFERHKGYGTAAHLSALKTYGPTPEHRRTFAPLREEPALGEQH